MSLLRLRVLYAAQGVALGLLMPFLVPLLDGRGLRPAELGLVLGVTGVISLAAYPIWGALADGPLGRPRAIALSGVIAAVGGLGILLAGSDPVALAVALSVVLLGGLPWGPLSDALALETLADDPSAYGRLRAWASLGWAVAAIAAGLTWELVGPDLASWAFALSALGLAALVLVPGRPRRAAAPRPAVPTTGAGATVEAALTVEAVPIVTAVPTVEAVPIVTPGLELTAATPGRPVGWRSALASPILLGFLLGLFVAAIGEHATWRYVGLRILDQGGGVLLVGLAAALPALVEIPVFASSRGMAGRLGLRMIFVLGVTVSAGLTLLIAVAPEPWMVTSLRALDGASYALRYTGMVLIIAALLPGRLHAVGQSLGWLIAGGVAPIVSDVVGGVVYDVLGGTALFVFAGLLSMLGGAIAYAVLSAPAFRRPGR